MRKQLRWFIVFLLTLFAASCSTVKQDAVVKLFSEGYIVEMDQNGQRIFVTEKWEGSNLDPKAAWLTMDAETSIMDPHGKKLPFQDLRTGWTVEVWSEGNLAESSPVQARAAKLIAKSNGEESTAVSKALAHFKDAKQKFIQSVSFDQEKKVWVVKIAELGVSRTLYVNLKTGEVAEQMKDPPKPTAPQKNPNVKQPPQQQKPNPAPASPKIVAQNDAFRIFQPAPNTVVGNTFTVKGEARVFEAVVSYSFEDGHMVLAKGHVQASTGAPEWGSFEIKITIDHATSPVGVLTMFEESAKDGSPRNELRIPVKFKEELVNH